MSETNQIPLPTDPINPSQQKLPKPSHVFNLTKDRFTDLLALRVNRPSFDRSKFSRHTFLDTCLFRDSTPRRPRSLSENFPICTLI